MINQLLLYLSNPIVVLLLLIWTIPWKGYALWKSARNKQNVWFIVILLANTLAILEIIYIFFSQKDKNKKPQQKIAKKKR